MTPTDGLIKACKDQAENCAYSATTFMIYLRWLRFWDVVGSVVTVVLGAIATWKIVAQSSPVIAATCAFLTTVIPLTMRAMRIAESVREYSLAAGKYTNLRDQFAMAADIESQKPFQDFETATKPYFERLERLREQPLTPPEWAFTKARAKHKAGHYDHDGI